MRVESLSAIATIATAAALIGSVSAEDMGPLVIAKQGYFLSAASILTRRTAR
jgi:hypothetical protein